MRSVINLVKTAQGYSIVEKETEINKPFTKKLKDKPKKFAQQNFTIYPYLYSNEDESRYVVVPSQAQWFNMHSVHQIEKKSLPEWFRLKKSVISTMNNSRFQKNEELYRRYRNYLIEKAKHNYLSPTEARRCLAGDAAAIIRIHTFLQKWGLINYLHPKHNSPPMTVGKEEPQTTRKDCFDRDRALVARSYGKDELDLLKKVTLKFRPLCNICDGVAGILWYQYSLIYFKKKFIQQDGHSTKIINEKEPLNFLLRVCCDCYNEGDFPFMLSPTDFVKKSCFEEIELRVNGNGPNKKKNSDEQIVSVLESNSFNLSKAAQQLKVSLPVLFISLMSMPMRKMERLLSFDPETDDEVSPCMEPERKFEQQKEEVQTGATLDIAGFNSELGGLEQEYREIYEQFLQAWLRKMAIKIERLSDWETSVQCNAKFIRYMFPNAIASQLKELTKD